MFCKRNSKQGSPTCYFAIIYLIVFTLSLHVSLDEFHLSLCLDLPGGSRKDQAVAGLHVDDVALVVGEFATAFGDDGDDKAVQC